MLDVYNMKQTNNISSDYPSATLYYDMILVKLGIRTLDDEPCVFQLALDEVFFTNATISHIAAYIAEVTKVRRKFGYVV